MYKATRLVEQAMQEAGLKFSVDESERNSYVVAGFGIENGPSVRVQFISSSDDNDVSVRLFSLISVKDEDKKAAVLKVLNQLNVKYRFLKFSLDDDGDVNVEYDVTDATCDACVGKVCCELFIRTMRIVDEAYPMLMRAMWM